MRTRNNSYLLVLLFCVLLLCNCNNKKSDYQDDCHVTTYVYKNDSEIFRLDSTLTDDFYHVKRIRDTKQTIIILLTEFNEGKDFLIESLFVIRRDTNAISFMYNNTNRHEGMIRLAFKKSYSPPFPCIVNRIEKYVFVEAPENGISILYNDEFGLLGLRLTDTYLLFKRTDIEDKDFQKISNYILDTIEYGDNSSSQELQE